MDSSNISPVGKVPRHIPSALARTNSSTSRALKMYNSTWPIDYLCSPHCGRTTMGPSRRHQPSPSLARPNHATASTALTSALSVALSVLLNAAAAVRMSFCIPLTSNRWYGQAAARFTLWRTRVTRSPNLVTDLACLEHSRLYTLPGSMAKCVPS